MNENCASDERAVVCGGCVDLRYDFHSVLCIHCILVLLPSFQQQPTSHTFITTQHHHVHCPTPLLSCCSRA